MGGIPDKAFKYKLGLRSPLEWVVDQYRISTDKRSGLVKNPNRENSPKYIISLIQRLVNMSLETVEIISKMPDLDNWS